MLQQADYSRTDSGLDGLEPPLETSWVGGVVCAPQRCPGHLGTGRCS